jgi:hypothetical protein
MIFLSDGECHIADQTVQDLCHCAVCLGFVACFIVGLAPVTQSLAKHCLSTQYHLAQIEPLPPCGE